MFGNLFLSIRSLNQHALATSVAMTSELTAMFSFISVALSMKDENRHAGHISSLILICKFMASLCRNLDNQCFPPSIPPLHTLRKYKAPRT